MDAAFTHKLRRIKEFFLFFVIIGSSFVWLLSGVGDPRVRHYLQETTVIGNCGFEERKYERF